MQKIKRSVFGHVCQLGYVTNDFDRSLAVFAENGVPQFVERRYLKIQTGAGEAADLHIGLAVVDGMQIELIQPLGGDDAIYRSALGDESYELHLHHICQLISDSEEFDRLKEGVEAGGIKVALWGVSPTGSKYFYADTRVALGHYIEYIYRDPAMDEAFLAGIPAFAVTP